MTWYQNAAWVVAFSLAFAGGMRIIELLASISKQLENVRYFLGQLETRMERVNDKLHHIEHHTHRAAIGKPLPEPTYD